MTQTLSTSIKETLRQSGIVVINESDKEAQQICIRAGLAMLVIPTDISKQEKAFLLKKYDGVRLIFIERCEDSI